MQIPSDFTPIQKCIVRAYIEHRSVPVAAVVTFHDRDSSYVREVIRKYKKFLREEDERLSTAAVHERETAEGVTFVALCSFPASTPSGGCI